MLIKGNAQFLFLLHLNSVNSDFMLKNVNYVKTIKNHLKISTEQTKTILSFSNTTRFNVETDTVTKVQRSYKSSVAHYL